MICSDIKYNLSFGRSTNRLPLDASGSGKVRSFYKKKYNGTFSKALDKLVLDI